MSSRSPPPQTEPWPAPGRGRQTGSTRSTSGWSLQWIRCFNFLTYSATGGRDFNGVCWVSITVVFDVVRLLAGVVRRHAAQLHPHQRVHDGFVLVLVDFGQLLRWDDLQRRTTGVLEWPVHVCVCGWWAVGDRNTLGCGDTTHDNIPERNHSKLAFHPLLWIVRCVNNGPPTTPCSAATTLWNVVPGWRWVTPLVFFTTDDHYLQLYF